MASNNVLDADTQVCIMGAMARTMHISAIGPDWADILMKRTLQRHMFIFVSIRYVDVMMSVAHRTEHTQHAIWCAQLPLHVTPAHLEHFVTASHMVPNTLLAVSGCRDVLPESFLITHMINRRFADQQT